MQLAGYAMIAVAVYFGLRATRPASAPAVASTASPPSSTVNAVAATPEATPGQPAPPGPGTAAPPAAQDDADRPSPEQMRVKFTPEAQAALDAQKGALAAACLEHGGKPPRRDFAVRVYFGPDGEEQNRRVMQTKGPEDAELVQCLTDAKVRLHVTKPGATVGVQIALSLP